MIEQNQTSQVTLNGAIDTITTHHTQTQAPHVPTHGTPGSGVNGQTQHQTSPAASNGAIDSASARQEQHLEVPQEIMNMSLLYDRVTWKAHWERMGQPWRTEPEIDETRQSFLTQRRAITPDIEQGIYPFKNIALSRADVEWLLATHESGRGPVDWSDESQHSRLGLDLRGAELHSVNLQQLPLAGLVADLKWAERFELSQAQQMQSSILLDKADLKGAHLEGARLSYARMHKADLRKTHLEHATLYGAMLESAYFNGALLKGTNLTLANLKGAFFWQTNLAEPMLRGANLEGVHLEKVTLLDERGVGPRMVDTNLGHVNISVAKWGQVRMLGEEHEAHQKHHDGRKKDHETRLWEYDTAVRANRQLAVALQAQGMTEASGNFAYRAQLLQRILLRRKKKVGQYLFSLFLDMLAGYGYRPGRSLFAYLLVLFTFAIFYYLLGQSLTPAFSPLAALIFSVTSFHGRGFFPGGIPLDSPIAALAALEAVIGLIIEISFIATFTQRFFGR